MLRLSCQLSYKLTDKEQISCSLPHLHFFPVPLPDGDASHHAPSVRLFPEMPVKWRYDNRSPIHTRKAHSSVHDFSWSPQIPCEDSSPAAYFRTSCKSLRGISGLPERTSAGLPETSPSAPDRLPATRWSPECSSSPPAGRRPAPESAGTPAPCGCPCSPPR